MLKKKFYYECPNSFTINMTKRHDGKRNLKYEFLYSVVVLNVRVFCKRKKNIQNTASVIMNQIFITETYKLVSFGGHERI